MKKPTRRETWTYAKDKSGEDMARCNACGELVPPKVWWQHKCDPKKVKAKANAPRP